MRQLSPMPYLPYAGGAPVDGNGLPLHIGAKMAHHLTKNESNQYAQWYALTCPDCVLTKLIAELDTEAYQVAMTPDAEGGPDWMYVMHLTCERDIIATAMALRHSRRLYVKDN